MILIHNIYNSFKSIYLHNYYFLEKKQIKFY
jgi:hypothetical protein